MARATAATWSAGPESPTSRSLGFSIAAGAVVMAAALALRVGGLGGGLTPDTSLLPLLFSAGGLCAAGLLRSRSPTIAWLITVLAAGIAAIELVGLVRTQQPAAAVRDWPVLVVTADAGLLLAAATAAAYATRGRNGRSDGLISSWRALCVLGLALVALAIAWAIVDAVSGAAQIAPANTGAATAANVDVWPLRASGRIAAGFIALATLGGVLLDFAPIARRAWARSPSVSAFPRALGDELLPTSAAMRRRGEEDERVRLAADLHARVLPDLRRAAAAAAASNAGGGTGEPVESGLRQAIEGVEHLMHTRQSVVLEEYGLVAALEWLAERAEQQAPLEVLVELDGATVDDPAAVPREVARAAFRVALLGIDNVVRHANAARVHIRLTVSPAAVNLVIADDGTGFDGDTAPRTGRGLMDIRTAANGVGATAAVEASRAGTRIAFYWSPPAR